jgi:5'-nucleotidase
MRILIDLDGVLADWGKAYGESLDAYGAEASGIPRHAQQTTFDLNAGRTEREKAIIAAVMVEPGFYRRLELIPGAKEALKAMDEAGHDVRICTSPWVANPTCASDKLNWVAAHYGSRWASRVIITTDKTLVFGDYLVDDKPMVNGSLDPSWEHVIFTQPYNVEIADHRRRLNVWSEWAEVLG